jgi:ankyrin repeat protein
MDALGLSSEQAAQLDASEAGRAEFCSLLESHVLTSPEALDVMLLEAVGDSLANLARTLLAAGARPSARWGAKACPLLQLACAQCDRACAEALVAAGADLDGRDSSDGTPLHYAAAAGAAALLPLLLGDDPATRQRRIDAQDRGGAAPLFLAAYLGQQETAAALLTAGADVRLRSAAGRTAAHYAASGGQAATLRLLLAAGAEVDAANDSGATALTVAANEGHAECCAALLAAGANPRHQDELGCTPLACALMCGRQEAAALLLPLTPNNLRTVHGLSAIQVAATCGHSALLRAALAVYTAPPHGSPGALDELSSPLATAPNGRGERAVAEAPLHIACGRNDSVATALLLAAGASSSVRDSRSRTPLHVAAQAGSEPCVAALLAAAGGGAAEYCAAVDSDGRTALAIAAAAGAAGVLRRLLKAGARADDADAALVQLVSAMTITEEPEEEEDFFA